MAYMDYPNIHTAFPGVGVDQLVPQTEAEVPEFGARIVNAYRQLVAIAKTPHGPRGQLRHNAFMLSGLMQLMIDRFPQAVHIQRLIIPLGYELSALAEGSPYWSTPEGWDYRQGPPEGSIGPPGLPLDPRETGLQALWPNQPWLTAPHQNMPLGTAIEQPHVSVPAVSYDHVTAADMAALLPAHTNDGGFDWTDVGPVTPQLWPTGVNWNPVTGAGPHPATPQYAANGYSSLIVPGTAAASAGGGLASWDPQHIGSSLQQAVTGLRDAAEDLLPESVPDQIFGFPAIYVIAAAGAGLWIYMSMK
jgi:hypothetical protein